jgi:hypothetical protein
MPVDSEFGVSIPNSLATFERHAWAMSVHTTSSGFALDQPLKLASANMTSHVVRWSGYYRAKQSGVQLLNRFVITWSCASLSALHFAQPACTTPIL